MINENELKSLFYIIKEERVMDFSLSKEHKLLQEMYRKFAENEVKPLAQEIDEEERFPRETVEKLAKYGFLGIPYPKEYEGQGADYLAFQIKDKAKEYNIAIVENKPLARILYHNIDVGMEIPPELYQAVAEILAAVMKTNNRL